MRIKESAKLLAIALLLIMTGCGHENEVNPTEQLAIRVRFEIKRSWEAYQRNADKKDPLYPIEAFSSLVVSGLTDEADRLVEIVADTILFDWDCYTSVLEVNSRFLGGLISMYHLSGDDRILEKARDLGDRMMPAFQSTTGIPFQRINLRTAETNGNKVNVAEAGTYLLEMGMLSYFTGNPAYYKAAKQSTEAIFNQRSEIGLVGEVIDIETGEWINTTSHVSAGTGSYYEYLYKGWLLFGDRDLKEMWDSSIDALLRHIPERKDSLVWYKRVDMQTGEKTSSVVTLRDAFMPSLLAVSGHMEEAGDLQQTWDWLWKRNGLSPIEYDFDMDRIIDPGYSLNPEIIESAWYLWKLTGNKKYLDMIEEYFDDLIDYCDSDLAFTSLKNVVTKEQQEYKTNHFLTETLLYFYLAFSNQEMYNLESVVFSTEAHPFLKAAMIPEKIKENLNIR